MNDTKEQVEINGIELEEGDSLWRYSALRTYNQNLTEQDPDDVLRETAEALVENYPEAVSAESWREKGHDPVKVVQANLKANPGIYDDTDLMNYHAMEVRSITSHRDELEITVIDWKEERKFTFVKGREEPYEGSYSTSEPLETLEKNLGVTILPVTEDDA